MITVAALVSCGAVWVAAIVHMTRPRRPAAPAPVTSVIITREEDRVRPALDANGKPIWVEAEDIFWHEIVSWPPGQRAGTADQQRVADA